MKTKRIVALLLVVSLFFTSYEVMTTANTELHALPSTVKIGLLTPLTGGLESLGPTFRDGAQLAIDDLNAKYGSQTTFELVVQDTQTTQTGAQAAMTALVNAGVVGVVGAAASSSTLAAIEIAKANNIPMISYASTSPALTTADDNGYLFRVVPSDAFQGKAGADLAEYYLKVDKVAVIGISDAYGQGLTGAFKDAFTGLSSSNEIVIDLAYDQETQTDFSGLVNQIANVNPDALYMVSFTKDGSALIDELAVQGVDVPIIGTDGIASDTMFDLLTNKDAFVGAMGTAPKITGTDDFVNAFETKYGYKPGIFVAESYDAAMIIGEAVIKAQSVDGPTVRDAIKEVGNNYQGVSGVKTFDDNGDIVGGVYDIWEAQKSDSAYSVSAIGTWIDGELTINGKVIEKGGGTEGGTTTEGGNKLPINLFAVFMALLSSSLIISLRKRRN